MPKPIISVEGLSKSYEISHRNQSGGVGGYRRLSEELLHHPRRLLSRLSTLGASAGTREEFWALRDVSFDIQEGDVVGVIGRNGAGKSTLLKILSRITEPTAGRAILRGRVASLLEVGTGFHPELTGRENIFLNGAILGMKRSEIKRKFDEIVAFAEVDKFIDTPVKRYSSGMYVRLAFSVAAHLDPEILIVDEVLAVGDANFQKKCLGKMKAVSDSGRTILFVSHQLGAIASLCTSAVLLNSGKLAQEGNVATVLQVYAASASKSDIVWKRRGGCADNSVCITEVKVLQNGTPTQELIQEFQAKLVVNLSVNASIADLKICITIQDRFQNFVSSKVRSLSEFTVGSGVLTCELLLPHHYLVPNLYSFRVALFTGISTAVDVVESACQVRVIDTGTEMAAYEGLNYGLVNLPFEWL